MRSRMIVGCLLAWVSGDADAATQEKFLRPVNDGPGLQAIFRVARVGQRTDLFGVVDPIRRRIQFYRLDDHDGLRSLDQRMKTVGDCVLPAKFRFWRLHHLGNTIVLQSQPNVTRNELNENLAFEHNKITLRVTPAFLGAVGGADKKETGENSLPEEPCDSARPDFQTMELFDPLHDSQSTVAISDKLRQGEFRVSRKRGGGGNSFLAETISIRQPGEYLSSIDEIEDAQVDIAGFTRPVAARHFLLTTRVTKAYGYVYTHVRVVRMMPVRKGNARVKLDVGRYRVKVGQRFAAVSSKGEILMLGAARAVSTRCESI